eukprot:1559425-Amphidinium_carterae.1
MEKADKERVAGTVVTLRGRESGKLSSVDPQARSQSTQDFISKQRIPFPLVVAFWTGRSHK